MNFCIKSWLYCNDRLAFLLMVNGVNGNVNKMCSLNNVILQKIGYRKCPILG